MRSRSERTRALEELNAKITACRACPRLVNWREQCGRNPPRAHAGQTYWARPLAGFGDPAGSLMVVGLAPAAHGGNRTGRMFTGDASASFLFKALHQLGLASVPDSVSRDDGARLYGCYLTAVVRCAPPQNKPTPAERDTCLPYLVEEIDLVSPDTIVALGRFAWEGVLLAVRRCGGRLPSPKPTFAHGAEALLEWRGRNSEPRQVRLFGSYHPSRQNTFTKKLTMPMLLEVLARAAGSR